MITIDCSNPFRFILLSSLLITSLVNVGIASRLWNALFGNSLVGDNTGNVVTPYLLIFTFITAIFQVGWALFEMFNHGIAGGVKDVVGDALAWLNLCANAVLLGFAAKSADVKDRGDNVRALEAFSIISSVLGIVYSLMRILGMLGTPLNTTTGMPAGATTTTASTAQKV